MDDTEKKMLHNIKASFPPKPRWRLKLVPGLGADTSFQPRKHSLVTYVPNKNFCQLR